MAGARGDALDWALALARAPGERMALRQRPLPEGIEPLLQIATGTRGDALQAALARTNEPEADLVEAVRFYLREVLFHSGADAYRMLGLARDASAEQIKTHHRLLQQWLHPDRQTSDWDAIFAGRVNAAWNALRTPEHRAEYDAAHPVPTTSSAWTTRSAPRVVAPVPLTVEAAGVRWRRRAPVLALFAACAVLGTVAVRDALRQPEAGYAGAPAQGERAPDRDAGAVALRLPDRTPLPAARPRIPADASAARPGVRERAASAARSATPGDRGVEPALPVAAPARQALPASAPVAAAAAVTGPAERPAFTATTVAAATEVRATVAAATPVEAPARAMQVAAPAVAETAPPYAAPTVPPPPAAASVERVLQAQRTGRELMAFLSSRSARVPPIWDSMAAQQRALGLRERLHERGQLRAGEPHWRVGNEDAALRTLYGEQAQVRAQFVWRDQRWLVSGVALEEAP